MKLPVLFEVRENLDRQIREIQTEIAAWNARLNGRNGDTLTVRAERGRPPKALIEARAGAGARVAAGASPWAKLTPDERSAEMKRRMAVTLEKKAAREVEEARRRKSAAISAARKKAWNALTPAQQKARLAKMTAGRIRTGHFGGVPKKQVTA